YSCLKCGRSGEARDANYRYRLSLEVADAHRVFLVTVFGSCLEAFFGVTAESLQRYIEDLNPEAGEAAREASPSVVIQAVETCFIGKKFIFGVKDSAKQDGAGRLQSNSEVGHGPEALTACQMFAPNPGLVGCTVLRYLRQQQCSSGSKGSHGGGWSPGGLFAALSQPSSELSSLRGSGDGDVVPSSQAQGLSGLWAQSFGLTSSSVSGGTAADLAALDSRRTARDEQKRDNSPVSLQRRNQSIDSSQDDNQAVNERNVQGGDKFCLCPTWHNGIFVEKEARSRSAERDDYRAVQNPLQTGKEDSPGKIIIQHSHGLERPHNPLQGGPCCPLVSCAGHSRDGRSSQGEPWLWDELPSSESLNEFIARIESGNATESPTETRAWEYFPSKGAGETHGCVNQTPPQLAATSTPGQAHEKLQEVAEKVDLSKEPVLSCHRFSQLSRSGKEYQPEASFRTLSTQGRDEWERLSDHHRLLLPWLSPVGIQPSGLKGSCPSPKEGVDRDVTGHENHCAPASLKAARSCLNSPARLDRKREDNAAGWRKEERSHCEPKQGVCERLDNVCEGQPLPEMHGNHCKEGEISSSPRDSSICTQGSYNASADLFDASTAGAEVVTGTLSTGQAASAQGGALTAKSTASGCQPRNDPCL
ncbi:PREDICTED: DNA damage-induced apoptosis suppressor protein-like, partial [Gekko japonicus]|uniref:DNA damage-induced apoptosis suppressor protein-like n=1 Tax=Gekko japonicus TaxID=146911 RepID=A0ABM1K9W2_GEKJA